jgi:hypothetical protein
MFINFWYPMVTTEELRDKPLAVRPRPGLRDPPRFGRAGSLSRQYLRPSGGSLAAGKRKGDVRMKAQQTGFSATG